jgi:hypothetical protein
MTRHEAFARNSLRPSEVAFLGISAAAFLTYAIEVSEVYRWWEYATSFVLALVVLASVVKRPVMLVVTLPVAAAGTVLGILGLVSVHVLIGASLVGAGALLGAMAHCIKRGNSQSKQLKLVSVWQKLLAYWFGTALAVTFALGVRIPVTVVMILAFTLLAIPVAVGSRRVVVRRGR